jgi:6-phosphogluconolactonase (cycloisomerase 2 family)
MGRSGLAVYTGIGRRFTEWELDEETLALTKLASLRLPANVQYAWHGGVEGLWYVVSSDGGGRAGPAGSQHHLTAVGRSDAGNLEVLGEPRRLPSRPIHVSTDPSGPFVLVAFSQPPAVCVYEVLQNGMVGDEVVQQPGLEIGNYPHQVLVNANDHLALVTSLGRDAAGTRLEEPGCITVLDFDAGKLTRPRAVAPNEGYGFGPRHLDVHRNGTWVYVVLERQNQLALFDLKAGTLSPLPRAVRPLLRTVTPDGIVQKAGAVHIHPRGHAVYAANRSDQGTSAQAEGDNSIVVFALDEHGVPNPVQRVSTMGAHCRTFHLDPEGRVLAAAHIRGTADEWPALTIFRVQDDGRLSFARRELIDTNGDQLFWVGMPPAQRSSNDRKRT